MGCCSVPVEPASARKRGEGVDGGFERGDKEWVDWLRLGVSFLGAAQVMMVSMAVNISEMELGEAIWLHHVLAWVSLALMLFLWMPLWRSVWENFKSRRVVIEQFFLIGIVGSYAASLMGSFYSGEGIYYEVPFVLFFIYYLGKVLGRKRESQARALTETWADVLGKARVLRGDGKMELVPVSELKRGEVVYVSINEWIPVDGRVIRGEALVDEMALSGEPDMVRRSPGDTVMAGSKVIDAGLEIEVLYSTKERRRGVDYILDRLRMVDMRESRYQKMADRFVRYFLPIVVFLAGATFLYWGWSEGSWAVGLYRALTVLVVACPCALGLATPIGLWSGFQAMTRRGIILRSPDFIERLNEVNEIVFDKTGTLSEERMRRVNFVKLDEIPNGKLEEVIGALQRHANHPIARAFEDWMMLPNLSDYACEDVRVLAGKGIEGKLKNKKSGEIYQVAIGNDGILEGMNSEKIKMIRDIFKEDSSGGVKVYVKIADEIVGVALLKEVLRSTTQKALEELKKMDLRWHVMSGDSEDRVRALGIERARFGMTANEKIEAVKRMREEGKRVLFVGDGMNDSGAMREAHVGIAVSSAIPLTREVAGAELAEARLDLIPEAIRVSRSVCVGLRRNLYFAAGYNAVGISLAIAGLINPVVAAVLMLGASMTVSWRALRWGEKLQTRIEKA